MSFLLKKNNNFYKIIIGDTMSFLDTLFHRDILKKIKNKHRILRLIIYFISCFMVALSYNVFLVPNNLVIGGMSGLAIVVKELIGMSTSTFLMLSTVILLLISYLLIGKKALAKNIFSAIMYPLMVTFTAPIAKFIHIEFHSYLFMVLFAIMIYSVFLGLIYKVGYSTGGVDIINQIICHYAKTSIGQAGIYINIVIIFISMFIFGLPNSIYAIFALFVENSIVDLIVLGNSDSKLCIIKTKNYDHIEYFLENEYNIGYSILESSGGIDKKKRKTIMCVVTSREYYKFKNLILDIDSKAFFATEDCYEVLGGKSKRLINFN